MSEHEHQKVLAEYQKLLSAFQRVRTERDMLRKVLRVARINRTSQPADSNTDRS